MAWYVDKGLAKLIAQWRALHAGASVGTIGDTAHQAKPSEHNPEADGSVDAGDFMKGPTVNDADLDALAETLRLNRDPRIAYVIRRQRIFSSTNTPWQWRPYSGDYHDHTHVSVNDTRENDTSAWNLGTPQVGEEVDMTPEQAKQLNAIDDRMAALISGAPSITTSWSTVTPKGTEANKLTAQLNAIATTVTALAARPASPAPVIDYDQLADAILRRIVQGPS